MRISRSRRAPAALALVSALCLLAGCSESSDRSPPVPTGANIQQGVAGIVLFEKPAARTTGLDGNGAAGLVPVRWARVELVRDVGGNLQTLASTITDADGRYGIGGTYDAGFQILVSSTSEDAIAPNPGIRVRVQDNPLGNVNDPHSVYGVLSAPQPAVSNADLLAVDVIASVDTPDRVAGAFNILDVFQRGAELWRDSTGIVPALAIANWEHGQQPRTSFYDPSTNQMTILGGVSGLEDQTDTDEFDDSILGHEFMHFLTRNHADSSSPGGQHGGEDLVPTLAYDEALANWFSGLLMDSPVYIDTLGNADGQTRCAFCDNLEDSTIQRVDGIGSEQSINEILWDLTDGAVFGPADSDGDAVALEPAEVLAAMVSYSNVDDLIHVTTLFDELVARGFLSSPDIDQLLVDPVNQNITFPPVERDNPPTGRDLFPIPIDRGEVLSGRVDAFGNNPTRGFDSSRYYAVNLPTGGTLRVTLDIQSNGTAPGDLELFLIGTRNQLFGSSETQNSREQITASLAPGRYIVVVQGYFDGQGGTPVRNAADYTLRIE